MKKLNYILYSIMIYYLIAFILFSILLITLDVKNGVWSKEIIDLHFKILLNIIKISFGVGILSFIYLYFYFQSDISKYQKYKTSELDNFYEDLHILDDEDLCNKLKEHYLQTINVDSKYDDKPLIEHVLKYEKIKTLIFLIRNNANIKGYEKEIEKLLPLTYSISDRNKYDFSDYFEDRY